jgi:N-acyl-D-amino-acid deacylase
MKKVADSFTDTGNPRPHADSGKIFLKNGLIVDGTGAKGFTGSLLLDKGVIATINPDKAPDDATVIDCTGLVIAPGFIDAHSHMDWVLPVKGRPEMKTPFTEQGITTFVAGQCGFNSSGYKKDTKYKEILMHNTRGLYDLAWSSMDEYFSYIQNNGMSHNLVNLTGHGMTRASIRGLDASPMKPEEMKEMLALLEEAMDQGAAGISLGLQYEPGLFATNDELEQIARLVKNKNKILSIHMKAYSALSNSYPIKPFGTPHNLIALKEVIDLARKTGVKLQTSHLLFAGSRTFKTYREALKMIDDARREGLDINLDTFAYNCGESVINVFLPPWFLAKAPGVYEDKLALLRLRMEAALILSLLGFGYEDIQISNAHHPDLNKYNGMFISEIAKARNMSGFDCLIDISKKSSGIAEVLNHKYSNVEIVEAIIKHPATLFMTDVFIPLQGGVPNPAAFGNYPHILQRVRDYELTSLEEAVRKMSGAVAERYQIKDRGFIRKGMAADITVFDYSKIKDNTTPKATNVAPTGIEAVFINGVQVVSKGRAAGNINAGKVIKV